MITIVGGTGFIGKELSKKLVNAKVLGSKDLNIYNYNEVYNALIGSKCVIHLASLKSVIECENNPIEAIKINIIGTRNIIDVCEKLNVKKIIYTSSIKGPDTILGITKIASEKLFNDNYSIIKVPNIIDELLNNFRNQLRMSNEIKITHEEVKRKFISLQQIIDIIIEEIEEKSNRIIEPKTSVIKIINIAKALTNNIKIIGLKKGETLEFFNEDELSEEETKSFIQRR